jgi:hypothetical protein
VWNNFLPPLGNDVSTVLEPVDLYAAGGWQQFSSRRLQAVEDAPSATVTCFHDGS